MRKMLFLLVVFVCSAAAFGQNTTEGSLYAAGKGGRDLGACPLKSTAVKADISGFLARVTVKQEFENKFTEPVEAVYVFPLSQNGAVDNMTMTVGDRVIRGKIMKRDDARTTYEAAKSEGKTASLLDQERPNIFTQSVANIMPGERVVIEISYVETLKYEDGAYEFVFPMVVAPRYIPGGVADARKISPPAAATRAGHDVSIEVNLNAGVPVEEIRSNSHDIDQINFAPNTAKITLRDEKVIPNKDFILRYDVSGKRIEDAIMTHRDERGGFFTMILQPPDKIATEDRTPKEIVFVLDTSGSMGGFPIDKAKEAMKLSLDGLYPDDTFNLITFAGDTQILFDQPVPATEANLQRAQEFLASQRGYGGTEMMTAIKAALEPSDASDHLRIVCFMTDGEVGNDDQIIAEVQRHPNARVFSFGIGSSVNRSLLDKIALEGKGEAEYVSLTDDGSKAAKKFYERVRTPLLTDLSIDWNGMPVADVYPNRLTDLFSAKPVIIHGRYTGPASGTIKLKGKVAGQAYERSINVNLPESDAANDVLATLWARQRIDDMSSDSLKTSTSAKRTDFEKQITNLALEFRIMSSFTSFVAVEDRVVNPSGNPRTVEVPVEAPEGTTGAKVPKTYGKWGNANGAGLSNGTGSGGTGSGRGSVSGGGGGNSQQTVNVTSGDISSLPLNARSAQNLVVVNTSSSSVSTTAKKTKSKRPSGTSSGRGSGSGNGSGFGYGSGRGSGNGTGDGVGSSESTFTIDGLDAAPATPLTVGSPSMISGGVLNGKATSLPQPAYPAGASAVRASGAVSVQITVDESGNVISANAVSGHPLLRSAAEQAASAGKFSPTMLSGKPVKISGVITYNFGTSATATSAVATPAPNIGVTIEKMKVGPLTPEEKRRAALADKLQFWLYAVVTRLEKGYTKPAPNETMFVRDGKADIRIELIDRSPEVLEKLKAAGFELTAEKGKAIVIGRIALDKLAALADIAEVKLILPMI